jgi:hypothetical protein
MDKKQAVIDDLHMQLRDASGELGEQRRRLEGLQAEMNERESRKRKSIESHEGIRRGAITSFTIASTVRPSKWRF